MAEPIRLWKKEEGIEIPTVKEVPPVTEIPIEKGTPIRLWGKEEIPEGVPGEIPGVLPLPTWKEIPTEEFKEDLGKKVLRLGGKPAQVLEITGKVVESGFWSIPKTIFTGIKAIFEPKEKAKIKENQGLIDKLHKLADKTGLANFYATQTALLVSLIPGTKFEEKVKESIEKIVQKPVSEYATKVIDVLDERQRKIAETVWDEKPGLSNWQEYVFTIESGALSLAEAIAVTYATKSTAAGAAVLSTIEASDEYNQARDAGLSPDEAKRTAMRSGIGTFILEKIGLDFLFGLGGSGQLATSWLAKNWLRRGIVASLFETLQEELQTVWQNVNRKFSYKEAQKISEGWWETAVAMAIPSFIAGILIPGVSINMKKAQTIEDISKKTGVSMEEAEIAFDQMVEIAERAKPEFEKQLKEQEEVKPEVALPIPPVPITPEIAEPEIKPIEPVAKPKVKPAEVAKPIRLWKEAEVKPVVKPEIKPKALPEKIAKVYAKIDLVKEGRTKIGRVVQEKTILDLIEKGQEAVARKAFSEGKKTGLFETKESYNEVVAKAKRRKLVQEVHGRIVTDIKKIATEANLKHLRPERRDNIKSILKDIELIGTTPITDKKLVNRLYFIKEHPDNMIPDNKIEELRRLDKIPLKNLTIDDLFLIRDTIHHEIKLNILKNKLVFGKQYKDAKETIKIARDNVTARPTKIKEDPTIIDSGLREPKIGRLRQIFTVDSYNPELVTEILDRARHRVIMSTLYEGIDEGTTTQLKNQQDTEDFFKKELTGINTEKWSKSFQAKDKNIDYQIVKITKGRSVRLTKGERVAFILHSKNKKNLAHILQGGFRFESNLARSYKITEEDLKMIVDSATLEEKKVADAFSRFLNRIQKPKINEVSINLNGWEIAVEPNYYPIRTATLDRIRDALKLRKNFVQFTLEGMGIFKERTNARNALIIEDSFKTIYGHLKKTSAYIGLAQPLRNAKMLLQDGGFEEDIIKTYGRTYYRTLDRYIKAIEDSSHNIENIEKLTTDLINKLDVAILGINPFVMFKQPVSYLMATTEMDIKYLKKAITTKPNYEEIKKWSPQLRERLDGKVTRELGELGQVGAVKKFFTGKTVINNKAMAGIRKFDYMTIGRIWNAVKFEVTDKRPTLKGNAYMEAVAKRAEEVIRLTQPTWQMKDRSAIGRSHNIFVRLLTKYTSQRNKNYNAVRRAILRYDTSKYTTRDKAKLFKNLFIILVVSSLLIQGIDEMRRKLYGRKSKGVFSWCINTIGNSLSYVYFVGDLFSSLISKVEKGTYGGWDTSNIVSSFINDAIDGLADGIRAIEQAITEETYKAGDKKYQRKWKTSALKSLNQLVNTIARLRGIPYPTIQKMLKGVWEIVSGKRFEKEEGKIIPKPPGF